MSAPREERDEKVSITLRQADLERAVQAADSQSVLELIRREGLLINAPCGGAGACGKCLVRVVEGEADPVHPIESRLVSQVRLADGMRLACLLVPRNGMTVELPVWSEAGRAKAAPLTTELEHDPHFIRRQLTLPRPTLDDQRADLQRILSEAGCTRHRLPIDLLRSLSALLRENDWGVTVTVDEEDKSLLWVEPQTPQRPMLGIAVDIGTTTVACYLIDLDTAHTIDVYSEINRQVRFGGDVVSRISRCANDGVSALRDTIVEQINRMSHVVTHRNGLQPQDVRHIVVAANTTMQHLFLGLDPTAIGVSPFIPAAACTLDYNGSGLALAAHPSGHVITLPCISGYVGSDIVAAILASGMDLRPEVALLIDIGTNGEIVLGNADWLRACSTAAGPAFEGAQIRCGTGGVDGAVNTFVANVDGAGRESDRRSAAELRGVSHDATAPFSYTTINDAPAVGICGAGIVDIVAALLDAGVIDDTGRLLGAADLPDTVPEPVRARCCIVDGAPAFVVVPESETAGGEALVLTEKDVREIQLAKAAIAAGIATLLEDAAIAAEDVGRVYLAGGFGSFLNRESAIRIGLLPPGTAERVEVLGNAAGIGAVMALASRSVFARCDAVAAGVRYIELSSTAAFQDHYIENMTFEL